MALTPVCTGNIGNSALGGTPTCDVAWTAQLTASAFDISQLDPAAIVSAFSAGFTMLFIPLSVVWAASVVIDMIRGR